MTQRIFDIYNEKDMQELFDILPEKIALQGMLTFALPRSLNLNFGENEE